MHAASGIPVYRAFRPQLADAYAIVSEYYEAVDVMVREDQQKFEREYFEGEGGLWLATSNGQTIGCIALHELHGFHEKIGEIKRLYVQPAFRGKGVAEALLATLETYATARGFRALYLDSKDDLQVAIRFYQRHGYELCERYNENPQATIFMKKQLH